MATIRNLVVKITADVGSLAKTLGNAQRSLARASNKFASIGYTLSSSITEPLKRIGSQATQTAADFEQSMANAASVSGATGEEFNKMQEIAREMGKTTSFSASEAADAMYYMASAGYKVEQIGNSIQPVLDLAAATQSDLAFSTDTVISTLNQFGLEANDASRVSNIFAAVIGNSQATLDKLAYSMRYVGPVANSLGYSLEDTTAALGMLYNAGFKGEQAGTILRGSLSNIIKPSNKVTKVLSKMGLTYDDISPSTTKFSDIISKLEGVSITTAQAVELFGQEAGPGMMALISQGSTSLEDMANNITDTFSASTMAERQLNTYEGSMKLMKSQIEEISISIGQTLIPMLSELRINYIQPLIDKFNGMSDSMKKNIVKIGLVTASIGPLFVGISKILKLGSSLAGMGKLIASPLLAKIALIVCAIFLVISVFKKLYNENEAFRETINKTWSKLKDMFAGLSDEFEQILESLAPLMDVLLPIIGQVVGVMLQNIINGLEKIIPIVEFVLSAFSHLINGITKLLQGDFKGAFAEFGEFFKDIFEGIKLYFVTWLNFMINGVNGFLSLVGKGLNFLIDQINKISFGVPDWVPIIGGGKWGFNISNVTMPQIPKLASGGVIPPNNEFLAILGDQSHGSNIEAPLSTIVDAFRVASNETLVNLLNNAKGNGEIIVRFEGLSENAFLSTLTPKVVGKAKNMGLI